MDHPPDLAALVGVWTSAFFILCIFSFLFSDNPFYKFAEHVFVGVSAGYWMVILGTEALKPNLFDRLAHAVAQSRAGHFSADWLYLVPALLGVLMIARLVPRISWVSRWPLAFLVGLNAGFSIVYYMEARILKQVDATIMPIWIPGHPIDGFRNLLIVVGVVCVLIYFYFSVEHRGWFVGGASRIGMYVLMISFGASFGYAVMARVSLLIGQLLFFWNVFWPVTTGYFHGGG